MKNNELPLVYRMISGLLFIVILFTSIPAPAYAAIAGSRSTTLEISSLKKVKPNRTIPKVKPPNVDSLLSLNPSDEEIFSYRNLTIPLIPEAKQKSFTENADLALILNKFLISKGDTKISILEDFKSTPSSSRWQVSICYNLGKELYLRGYFTKAMQTWQEGWSKGKDSPNIKIRSIADACFGEYLKMNCRVGRLEVVDHELKHVTDRVWGGAAKELINNAIEAVGLMKNQPEICFMCGPYALRSIAKYDKKNKWNIKSLEKVKSTKNGFSLEDVESFSKKCNMPFIAVKRELGGSIPLPAVVHWKLNHYGALIGENGDEYLLKDPTFGSTQWISKKALDEESSGYFLIDSQKAISKNWTKLDSKIKKNVFGKGNTRGPGPGPDPGPDGGDGEDECKGMPVASVIKYDVSLLISDEPIVYPVTIGSEISFRLNYIQREDSQPVIFDHFNFGDKWRSKLLSYVKEEGTGAEVIQLGGGVKRYEKITKFEYKKPSETRDQLSWDEENDRFVIDKKDGTQYLYAQQVSSSSNGNRYFLTQIIDPQGVRVTFNYDDKFRLRSIVDGAGFVSTLNYSLPPPIDDLKVTSITDPFGRTALFYYDDENLVGITDALGYQSRFQYKGSDIVRMTTPYGTSYFTTNHSETKRSIILEHPNGEIEKYAIDEGSSSVPFSTGSKPQVEGFAFRDTYMNYRNTFYWDKKQFAESGGADFTKAHVYHWLHTEDNYTSQTLESEKAPLESRIYYRYEGQGDNNEAAAAYAGSSNQPILISRITPSGTQYIQRAYNSKGNITLEIDPAGRRTTYVYYPNNIDLHRVIQGSDVIRQYGYYNSLHVPSSVTNAAGEMTSFTYTGVGKVKTSTNPKGELTEYKYDGNHNLIEVKRNDRIEKFGYDSYNHLSSYTSPDNYTITYEFDNLDNFLKATYPDGTTEQQIYDRLVPIWQKDRLNRWTRIYYDQMRRVSLIQDPQGGITQFEWCICGLVRSIIDPNGNKTQWHHDLQSRLTEKNYADGTKELYKYDSIGRLIGITDAMGQKKSYSYRIDNLLSGVSYSNAVNPTPSLSFIYDTIYPRMISRTDGIGTTQYSYRPIGQKGALLPYQIDGPWENDTIEYEYDKLNRVISRSIGGVAQTSTFDALGRPSSSTNPLGVFTYAYDEETYRINSILYPNGQKMLLNYQTGINNRQIQSIENLKVDLSVLSKFEYQYDTLGNITQWDQQRGSSPKDIWKTGYDLLNQLTQVQVSREGSIIQNEEWSYDKVGNRISSTKEGLNRFYETNNLNQLTISSSNGKKMIQGRLTRPGSVTIQGQNVPVDSNKKFSGLVNVLQGTNNIQVIAKQPNGSAITNNYQVVVNGATAPVTLTYDLNGNLLSDGDRAYQWDAENRLIKIQKGSDTWEFAYNGYFERVQEKKNGAVTKRWLWARSNQPLEERDASDNVIKRFYSLGFTQGTANYFYTKDHLGSIREVTDETENLQARYIYDAWGNRTKVEGGLDADFGYTGHLQHESGLILAKARAYDPNTGRWISRDTFDEMGPDGPGRYGYGKNAPLEMADPNGEFALPVIVIVLLLILNADPANAPAPGDPTLSPTSTGGIISDTALGFMGGLVLGKAAQYCKAAIKVKPKYDPRIRARGVEDPKAHNFPYSFDDTILKSQPKTLSDGSKFYEKPGSLNQSTGKYEIIVNDENIIFHRNFNSKK